PGWVIFAQVLHAATFGAFHASAVALIHHYFRGRHQARGQGIYSSLAFGAGGTLGGLYAGVIWDSLGAQWTFAIAAGFAALGFGLVAWKLKAMEA
ncbi:MAG: MFS transporter, partial [Sulfuriferula sp.]